jgi:hypothetical protein
VVTVPGGAAAGPIRLYRGVQVIGDGGTDYPVSLAAGTARVEPPRFTVDGGAPVGTRFEVTDSHQVRVTAPTGRAVTVTLRSTSDRWTSRVRVPAGRSRALTVPHATVTPTTDLARGRVTFPTSPLPAGMTEPRYAVDGDPRTAWQPGPTGRMVVDTGAVRDVAAVRLTWSSGRRRPVTVEVSSDGLTYLAVTDTPHPGRVTELAMNTPARYVAVVVAGWRPGDAALVEVAAVGS